MIRLVLRVLLYVIITLDCLRAAELAKCVFEMMRVNNVEPVRSGTENKIKMPQFKAAIRLKLREIFANQYPNCRFSFRDFRIENWPSGIDPCESYNWTRRDLELIDERIPFYRFVPRETVVNFKETGRGIRNDLKNFECLTSANLRKTSKDAIMKDLLIKFKMESGQTYATEIDWALLDRSRVPAKYDEVSLNEITVSSHLIYKNFEIIRNIHFRKSKDDGTIAVETSDNEITECTTIDCHSSDTQSNVLERDNLIELDNILEGSTDLIIDDDFFDSHSSIIDKSLNDSDFDIKLDEITSDDFEVIDVIEVNVNDNDCLSERSADVEPKTKSRESTQKEYLRDQRNAIKTELENIFKLQHPTEVFQMRKYEILSWPDGISKVMSNWWMKDIRRIRENKHNFVFIKRAEKLTTSSEFGFDDLGNLSGILNKFMTKKGTHDILIKRYREETGESDAYRINWDNLDRRDIPAKYDGAQFNGVTMKLTSFYRNPEIVYNIHFYKTNGNKRKRETDQISS